jgi:acetate kinase
VDDIGGAGLLELEAAGRAPVKESAEVLEHKIAVEKETEISPRGARVRAFVIPTNEEILIARDTLHLVSGRPPS